MQTKQATHTPGPWHRNIKADGKYAVIFAGRNQHIAAASGHGELSGEEIEANISLIAAAPELLEALEQLVDAAAEVITYENSPITRARDAAIRAIAKATG